MGRAIDMEKDIDVLKKEVEQLKTAFSGLADTVDSLKDTATTKKHVDLHTNTKNVRAEDKPPKKNKKAKTELVEEATA
tara:strand:- start:280 stop:513 length:234 start_codon:yes stop_codon:yes gene_type:complete